MWLLQEGCSPPMARCLFRRCRSAGHKRRVPVAVHHLGREEWLAIDNNKSLSVTIEECPRPAIAPAGVDGLGCCLIAALIAWLGPI